VLHRQRAHRHAGLQAGHLDRARMLAFGQQGHALHRVRREAARGVEATRIVDHDRRLLDLLDEVEAAGQRFLRGLLADDDLDQRHLVDRREEVQANVVLRIA